VLDLIRHFDVPVVVAARSSLGTINHTLLTVAASRSKGVEVKGVVMLGHEDQENEWAIEHYGSVPVVGRVPYLETINRRALLETYYSHFDRRVFE